MRRERVAPERHLVVADPYLPPAGLSRSVWRLELEAQAQDVFPDHMHELRDLLSRRDTDGFWQ
eukprot:1731267-Alexandrium_andersonii.AAC.1